MSICIYYIYLKQWFIPVMTNVNFQQPLLQASLSNDPLEIILICWFRSRIIIIKSKMKKCIFQFLWEPWYTAVLNLLPVLNLIKKNNTFIQQGYIQLFKSDSKAIYAVTKDLYFKWCSFYLPNNNKNNYHGFHNQCWAVTSYCNIVTVIILHFTVTSSVTNY